MFQDIESDPIFRRKEYLHHNKISGQSRQSEINHIKARTKIKKSVKNKTKKILNSKQQIKRTKQDNTKKMYKTGSQPILKRSKTLFR